MFTINLKELDLDPKITEDKTISNSDRDGVLDESEKYVQEKYPNIYNPYTLRRKISDIVKNAEGMTHGVEMQDKFDKKSEEDRKNFSISQDQKYKKLDAGRVEIVKKYDEQYDELMKWYQAELEKASTEEEKSKVEAEFENKKDAISWERDKADNALWKSANE